MFTGLVQDLGEVLAVDRSDAGVTIKVRTKLRDEIAPGDSIAVNGVCLTATTLDPEAFSVEVMNETLRRTSIGQLLEGSSVNLELALRPTDRLGGHIVQGHVDGVAALSEVAEDGFARVLTFESEPAITRYLVEKGSVAIEGVSLTVVSVTERTFAVSLIPETLERTTLGTFKAGDVANVEVDLLAKYAERLVLPQSVKEG